MPLLPRPAETARVSLPAVPPARPNHLEPRIDSAAVSRLAVVLALLFLQTSIVGHVQPLGSLHPGLPPADEPALAFSAASTSQQVAPTGDAPSVENGAASSEHSGPSSEHSGLSSEHSGPSSEHNGSGHSAEEASALAAIAAPLLGKRRVSPDLMRETLLQLCQGRSLSLAELGKLTDRAPTTLRTHYLSALVDRRVRNFLTISPGRRTFALMPY